MGLFDNITVSKKWLPQEEGTVFQTKDLECYMYYYHINDDGSITLKEESKAWAEKHKDCHTHDFSDSTGAVYLYDNPRNQYVAFVVNGIVKEIIKQ